MKRGAFKPSTSTLKRSGFLRTVIKEDRAVVKARKAMRTSRPRMTPIRASARDEECTLRFEGVCNYRTDTTVLCHSNLLSDGKGMGLKAPDTSAAYGCEMCHAVLDGRACRLPGFSYEAMIEQFKVGVSRTHERLRKKGLMPEGADAIARQGATPSDSQSPGVADHEKL